MSGVHGRNCELRISVGETAKKGVKLKPHADPKLKKLGVFVAPDRNWKWAAPGEEGAARVTYESPAGTKKEIGANSRLIHYAGGAIKIPDEDLPDLVPASVTADYTTVSMETIGSLLTDEREFELELKADVEDTTTIGEAFKSFVEGIPEWGGSLDGLYLNPETFKLAMANTKGLVPRKILRLRPRADKPGTYWQGMVIIPEHKLSGGHDSAIAKSLEFSGRGPLDLVEDAKPVFFL